MKHVAILGLGLMGGSLGLALKRRYKSITVHGYTRSKARGKLALKRKAIDFLHDDPVDAVCKADIVVLCAPILAIPKQLEMILGGLKKNAVITDVGSTKTHVQEACDKLLAGKSAVFVGSHPIAGSEQQGIEAARADLYKKAMVVITPTKGTPRRAISVLKKLWTSVGADIHEMSAEEHDRILALTSHLPHIAASLIATTVGRPGLRADLPAYCGTGYLDTTRIAEGGVDIWIDILKSNREPIIQELLSFRKNLNHFIEKLEEKEFTAIEGALVEGKSSRKAFTEYGHQTSSKN